jgi:hypothetical protein
MVRLRTLIRLTPNNLGDLFATDLREMFQSTYNGITATSLSFTSTASYTPSPEGKRIWALVHKLDTSAPDRDSRRLERFSLGCDLITTVSKPASNVIGLDDP